MNDLKFYDYMIIYLFADFASVVIYNLSFNLNSIMLTVFLLYCLDGLWRVYEKIRLANG
jgi:hypothetical protein